MTRALLAAFAGAFALSACSEEQPVSQTEPRPIKAFTVTDLVDAQMRSFSAIVEAADSAALSFQIGGNVAEVNVTTGQAVSLGDVIASLDAAPYELDVQGAEAELERAQADLDAKASEVERQRTLHARGWTSDAAIEQHEAAYAAAMSSVEYARSRLGLARRNLVNTEIRAPFDGVISSRSVEPFQDVSAGQPLFEIIADGALQAAFSVPETSVAYVTVGQSASARVGSLDAELPARVTEVGIAGREGASYPVRAALFDAPASLRPGMTAEVTLQMRGGPGAEGGYLIPLAAIAPGDAPNTGFVFKYDADAGVVRRARVVGVGARDNLVVISEGLAPGDVLAAAGVSFLMDGQAVRLPDQIAGE
ncbi:MAG: efflux RND transporter periplasmic adaptor subunit [Maricaulaceae bacterium]|jgi:RND family efflux transporter MFP subunit